MRGSRSLAIAALLFLARPASSEVLTLFSDSGIPPLPASDVIVYGCSLQWPSTCFGGVREGFNGKATDRVPPEGFSSWKTTSTFPTASEYAGWGLAFRQPENLRRFFANGELRFWIYSTTPNIQLEIKNNSGAAMTPLILNPPLNQWVHQRIRLNQYVQSQGALANVINPFLFTSINGPATFYIDNVRFVDVPTSPYFGIVLRNRSNNLQSTTGITWSAAQAASGWKMADQYIELHLDPMVPSWGVQIYTDNMHASASPRFTGNPITSDPAGLVNSTETDQALPMAWKIVGDSTTVTMAPAEPNLDSSWLYMRDRSSPGFANGNIGNGIYAYATVRNNEGIQYSSALFGSVFSHPNPIFLEANFNQSLGGRTYRSNRLIVEYFTP